MQSDKDMQAAFQWTANISFRRGEGRGEKSQQISSPQSMLMQQFSKLLTLGPQFSCSVVVFPCATLRIFLSLLAIIAVL